MYIGHFAMAYILIRFFPGVPPLVSLIGVSFPDILWPIFIWLGFEKAEINPDSPLQKYVKFTSYPYSHSLIVSFIISGIVGLFLTYNISPIAGILFVIASASHWLLDTIVHLHDLPILGFGRDKKVGLGLWNHPRMAFVIEYIFYALIVIIFMPTNYLLPLIVIGTVGHLINANSFLGYSKTNPFKSAKQYAVLALVGFIGFSLITNYVLGG